MMFIALQTKRQQIFSAVKQINARGAPDVALGAARWALTAPLIGNTIPGVTMFKGTAFVS